MKVISWNELNSSEDKNPVNTQQLSDFFKKGSAVSIGCFDGPHGGHEILFKDVKTAAAELNLLKGIVTFSNSIAGIKHSETYPGNLSTIAQRISYFETEGFDFLILIDFSDEFSKIKGTDFFDVLRNKCNLKFLAEGVDFKCGHKGLFNREKITEYVFEKNIKVQFENLILSDGMRVSSTLIRQAVRQGNFKSVHQLLGRSYEIDLNGIPFEKSGNTFVFRRKDFLQVLPSEGMYDVFVNTSRRVRSRLEACPETILVGLAGNENPRIRSIIFINKE